MDNPTQLIYLKYVNEGPPPCKAFTIGGARGGSGDDPMTTAIDIIHRDHVNIARVLDVLAACLPEGDGAKPDFELLERIVYYMRVFPDRFHHPKEEKFLFPALRTKDPSAGPVLDELAHQHAEGERLLDVLAERVHAAEAGPPERMAELRQAVDTYVAFQRSHMSTEETEILPRAREHLADSEWHDINRAFAADHDPLFGDNLETGFRALLAKITG